MYHNVRNVYLHTGECINQVRTIGSLYTNLFRLLRSCPGIEDLQLPIVKEGFKYKEFCWAVSTVMSRQNKILAEVGSKMHTPALIPVWDFCNHSNGEVRMYAKPLTYTLTLHACVLGYTYSTHTVEPLCIGHFGT